MAIGEWTALGGFAFLVVAQTAGAVLYIERGKRTVALEAEAKMATLKRDLEVHFDEEVGRLEKVVDIERQERQRDFDRIQRAMEGFAQIPQQVALVAQAVQNLTDRWADRSKVNESNFDDLKHSMRGMEQRLQAMPVRTAQPRRRVVAGG